MLLELTLLLLSQLTDEFLEAVRRNYRTDTRCTGTLRLLLLHLLEELLHHCLLLGCLTTTSCGGCSSRSLEARLLHAIERREEK